MATEQGNKEEIQVPDTVMVRCPLVRFKLRCIADTCMPDAEKNRPACVHFCGVSDRFPGSNKPFAVRYLLLCAAEPQKRELLEIDGA